MRAPSYDRPRRRLDDAPNPRGGVRESVLTCSSVMKVAEGLIGLLFFLVAPPRVERQEPERRAVDRRSRRADAQRRLSKPAALRPQATASLLRATSNYSYKPCDGKQLLKLRSCSERASVASAQHSAAASTSGEANERAEFRSATTRRFSSSPMLQREHQLWMSGNRCGPGVGSRSCAVVRPPLQYWRTNLSTTNSERVKELKRSL